MDISDIALPAFLILVAFYLGRAAYRDYKNPKPLGNFQNIHTLTQSQNLIDQNVERDNSILSKATEHYRETEEIEKHLQS